MRHSPSILFLFVVACTMLACRQTGSEFRVHEPTEFSWGAILTAPHGYPVELHKGYFATQDSFVGGLFNNGVESAGWQEEGTMGGMGGDKVPSVLSITWISYAEKKFWTLHTTIDSTKMRTLFEKGFDHTDRLGVTTHITYTKIIIGLAPGGVVVVWLAGPFRRVEIGRYQAQVAQVDANEFVPVAGAFKDNEDFFDQSFEAALSMEQEEEIKTRGIPYGLWDAYRVKYNWKFTIQFYNDDQERRPRKATYFNGEKDISPMEGFGDFRGKPIPLYASFYFREKWGEAYFDYEEMVQVFKLLTSKDANAPMELIGKINFMYTGISFKAKSGDKEVDLKKVKINIWNN